MLKPYKQYRAREPPYVPPSIARLFLCTCRHLKIYGGIFYAHFTVFQYAKHSVNVAIGNSKTKKIMTLGGHIYGFFQ